ncbi:MAG TPA: VWA domain-containing protein [Syntrophales bacterium]|nr:VWA domain-containing protein [Syntrophales bacterium]HPQ42647.1 VWA domain-containing protein [Syntrophales bacterium]
MTFRLAYPEVLVLLLPVAGWLIWALRRKPAAITYSMTSVMSRLAGRTGWLAGRIPMVIRVGCLVLLVLAAARPQMYNVSREIKSPGVDIMLCLDASGSMQALDFTLDDKPASRLAAVKKVVGDFIKKRETDRIGLVVFGTQAFTQSPLTLDKGLLIDLVKRMEIGMAGDKTAIGSAIAIGGKRLKDLKAKSKILILLTDGRQTAGSLTPEEAAEAAQALGIKIYTIGVGGTGPAPFPVQTPFGTQLIRQPVDMDEETLTKVAEIGHGEYFRAADTKRLQEIYDIIDRQEKTEATVKEFFHFRELYPWFLLPALLLLMAEIILRTTLLRTIP